MQQKVCNVLCCDYIMVDDLLQCGYHTGSGLLLQYCENQLLFEWSPIRDEVLQFVFNKMGYLFI